MKVEIKCPQCGSTHDIDSDFVGQKVICDDKWCGAKFVAQLPPAAKKQTTSDLGHAVQAITPKKTFSREDLERESKSGDKIYNYFVSYPILGIMVFLLLCVLFIMAKRAMLGVPTQPVAVTAAV